MIECLNDYNEWMIKCHFYLFLKKRLHGVLYLVVFNQWLMMRFIFLSYDAFYFAMHFILIHLRLY